jgi:hypothetical protein
MAALSGLKDYLSTDDTRGCRSWASCGELECKLAELLCNVEALAVDLENYFKPASDFRTA